MSHAVIRTSPKGGGQKFIGRCTKCGKEGQGLSGALEDCPADEVVSDEKALIDIIEGPKPEVDLHSTADATVWADEFCKRWPTAYSQVEGREGVETEEDWREIMVGWFANAIMAGVDSESRKRDAHDSWKEGRG